MPSNNIIIKKKKRPVRFKEYSWSMKRRLKSVFSKNNTDFENTMNAEDIFIMVLIINQIFL